MDKIEFIKQVESYIRESYSKFEYYQSITWDILYHADKLFREYNLDYQLAFGTLLGVIRDGDKIPWDYDVDVFVKIDDYDKLIEILDTKLGDDYYYVWTNKMSNYPAECLRICKRGYTYMSFHVDVFFLVGCPKNESGIRKYIKQIHRLASLRVKRHAYKHTKWAEMSMIKRCLLKSYYIFLNLIPESYLIRKEARFLRKYSLNDSNLWAVYSVDTMYGNKKVNIYPSIYLRDTIDFECNGYTLKIPKNPERYLESEFGDYLNYMPIKTRFEEFYTQVQNIEERQKFYEENILK